MNIFTGFIPPIHFIPPVQKHSGPEKISRKHIYTEDKNFLVPLELQLRETYLQKMLQKTSRNKNMNNVDKSTEKPYENRLYKQPVLATGRGQTSR